MCEIYFSFQVIILEKMITFMIVDLIDFCGKKTKLNFRGVLVIDSVGGVEIAKLKDILGIEPLPTILELTKEILDDREYALVVENIRIE